MTLQRLIIGYGYQNFLSFYWLLLFVVLGWFVIWQNNEGRSRSASWRFIYSLDMILPIIQLDERNYQINLSGFALYYFYLHKLVGYVLASFIVAGLSGLTK